MFVIGVPTAILLLLQYMFQVSQYIGLGFAGIGIALLITVIAVLAGIIVLLVQDRATLLTKRAQPEELKPPAVELSMNDLVIRKSFVLPYNLEDSSFLVTDYLNKQRFVIESGPTTRTYLKFRLSPLPSLKLENPDKWKRITTGDSLVKDKKLSKWYDKWHESYRRTLRSNAVHEVILALSSVNPGTTRCKAECRPYLYRQLTMTEMFGHIKETITGEQVKIARHECITLLSQLASSLGGNMEISADDLLSS